MPRFACLYLLVNGACQVLYVGHIAIIMVVRNSWGSSPGKYATWQRKTFTSSALRGERRLDSICMRLATTLGDLVPVNCTLRGFSPVHSSEARLPVSCMLRFAALPLKPFNGLSRFEGLGAQYLWPCRSLPRSICDLVTQDIH